jgi:simple sugar transport system permease protein
MVSGAEIERPQLSRGIGRFTLEIRQHVPLWQQAAILAGGLIVGLLTAVVVLLLSGVGFADLYDEFVVSIFSNTRSISSVLVQAGPLTIVGLSAAVAFKVRFWNIGIEGQMIFGSIFATFVAIHDVGPQSLRLVIMLLAAAIGGLGWIALPAWLKLKLGVNEIISTLLLNYVALNFLLHLLYGAWKDPRSAFPNSEQYQSFERLPLIGWESLTYVAPLAIVLALVCWWLLAVSRQGFFMRFASANPRMAQAIGIPLGSVVLMSALLSGALSGIAGFAISAGIESRMTQSFFIGYGFSGILIGFLARNNPLAVLPVAVFVAILFVAGQSLQVFYQIPAAMVQLIQALIVISVAGSDFFIRHRVRRIR